MCVCTNPDVHVVCYNVSMEMGEDECAPVNQLESIDSYIDCCTLQDRDSVSTLRYTIEEEQCTFCGKRINNHTMYTLQ